MEKNKGISGSTLKILALIFMAIDHCGASVVENYILSYNPSFSVGNFSCYLAGDHLADLYGIMRLIGRIAFPIFCFLLVEGSRYSKHKAKYLLNLFIFALISEVPFDLALFKGQLINLRHQNVFFTLLIGLAAIFLTDRLKSLESYNTFLKIMSFTLGLFPSLVVAQGYYKSELADVLYDLTSIWKIQTYSALGVAVVTFIIVSIALLKADSSKRIVTVNAFGIMALAMLIADLLNTDYSSTGIITIMVMYWAKENIGREISLGALSLTLSNFIEGTSFLAVPIVKLYNGKRGLKLKYFFYAFYPAHLIIFYLICKAMGTL